MISFSEEKKQSPRVKDQSVPAAKKSKSTQVPLYFGSPQYQIPDAPLVLSYLEAKNLTEIRLVNCKFNVAVEIYYILPGGHLQNICLQDASLLAIETEEREKKARQNNQFNAELQEKKAPFQEALQEEMKRHEEANQTEKRRHEAIMLTISRQCNETLQIVKEKQKISLQEEKKPNPKQPIILAHKDMLTIAAHIESLEKFLEDVKQEKTQQPFYSRRIQYENKMDEGPQARCNCMIALGWIFSGGSLGALLGLSPLLIILIIADPLSMVPLLAVIGGCLILGIGLILIGHLYEMISIGRGPERFNDAPLSLFSDNLKKNLSHLINATSPRYILRPMAENTIENENKEEHFIYIGATAATVTYETSKACHSITREELEKELKNSRRVNTIFEALNTPENFDKVDFYKQDLLKIISRNGHLPKELPFDINHHTPINKVCSQVNTRLGFFKSVQERNQRLAEEKERTMAFTI